MHTLIMDRPHTVSGFSGVQGFTVTGPLINYNDIIIQYASWQE